MRTFDPYGQPLKALALVQRGARPYSPLLGRFRAVDSGVAAVGNAIQGNGGAAALYGIGAVTDVLGTATIKVATAVVKGAQKITSMGIRGAALASFRIAIGKWHYDLFHGSMAFGKRGWR